MDPIKSIRRDLESIGQTPNKLRGQNFLIAESIRRRILDAAELDAGDTVLEIGSGTGILTWGLASRGVQIVAVEIDPGLAALCRERFDASGQVTVRELNGAEWPVLMQKGELKNGFKCISNLPYAISSPVIMALSRHTDSWRRAVLMIQKEVAQRITADPGSRHRGLLSVLSQMSMRVEYLFSVPPSKFWPPPKVDSAVIRLVPRDQSRGTEWDQVFEFCRNLFHSKRKTVVNNLKRVYPPVIINENLSRLKIDGQLRPEMLETSEIIDLARSFPGDCEGAEQPC